MKMILATIVGLIASANYGDMTKSEWISVKDAPVFTGEVKDGIHAAPGTSWLVREFTNAKAIKSATWKVSGLGVFEVYVNGARIGEEILKPGFTHYQKTKYYFTYDVTKELNRGAGEANVLAAEVSAGWWRDKIVTPAKWKGFAGKKSAFRGELEIVYVDGTSETIGTESKSWKGGIAGAVKEASIFDGEWYDARQKAGYEREIWTKFSSAERNDEFKGEILPSNGAEIYLRQDLAMKPAVAYCWKGIDGADETHFGTVRKTREFLQGETIEIGEGETLVLDFAQNAAAVPKFEFAAKAGTVLTALPAEMLNETNGLKSRGNDGPEGSTYRVNLRQGYENGRLIEYTFCGKGMETYLPRFTFFGYRYMSVTATAPVKIRSIISVPVSSIRKDMERGRILTGDESLNRFISNAYWGQLSNYLSVPTDCPQRNERLGWTADTQVFCETATFNADVYKFLAKWMRDERDSQHEDGSFPSVAPFAQYGNEGHRLGWADAGIIVPYTMWHQYGDTRIVKENYEAMKKYLNMLAVTEARLPRKKDGTIGSQYADWLSFEDYEPHKVMYGKKFVDENSAKYWDYLSACYWYSDSKMMAEMAKAIGRNDDAKKYDEMANKAISSIRSQFIDKEDGMLINPFRGLQGAAVFALKLGVLTDEKAIESTKAGLKANIAEHEGCLTTGFLGTAIILDALHDSGMAETAHDLVFSHGFPGWLYSVDQGATTVWERWNSYTKKEGFGPVGMNSFNHYAYGSMVGWLYRRVVGIETVGAGFREMQLKPNPDKRYGFVRAEYESAAGLIKSAWRYEGEKWIWEFTIPEGAVAWVTIPGENIATKYQAGTYKITK